MVHSVYTFVNKCPMVIIIVFMPSGVKCQRAKNKLRTHVGMARWLIINIITIIIISSSSSSSNNNNNKCLAVESCLLLYTPSENLDNTTPHAVM